MEVKKTTFIEVVLLFTLIVLITYWSFSGNESSAVKKREQNDADTKIVYIHENIKTDTVWRKGNTYIIRIKDFHIDKKLTIEPGVVIQFSPDAHAGQGAIVSKN